MIVNYTDDKAASITLTANAALPTPGVSTGVSVAPGAYARLQVLFLGQVSDPGRPTADASGHIGGIGQIVADNSVTVTVNAVDSFFNPVTFTGPVSLISSDGTPENSAALSSGTGSGPVQFFNAGPASIGAINPSIPASTWYSDQVNVLTASTSPALNVVHASPNISDVVLPQSGVAVFDFNLNIPVGQQSVLLSDLVVHATDQAGNPVALNQAFSNLSLADAQTVISTNVTAVSGSSVTVSGPITVNTGAVLPVTLTADVPVTATAQTIKLTLNQPDWLIQIVPSGSVTVATVGDPTGFPMVSGVMAFSNGELSKTYRNYPNPFHAGSETTTIEFNLLTASTVSLELYDVMGNRVGSLLKNASLPAGLQRVTWDGKNGMSNLVLNGIYYAQLDVNGTKLLLKIAVVK